METVKFRIDDRIIEDIKNTDDILNYKINEELGNNLKFGICISKLLTVEINNTDNRYEDISIYSKELEIFKNNVSEGIYYISNVERKNGKITITAYDKMIKLEKVWKQIKTPITMKNLLIETLKQANISMNENISFTNQNYVIWDISDCIAKSCREVISYILELAGANARINNENMFEFVYFSNKEIKINVDNVLKLSTGDDYITVDNLSYFRSDMEYFKTNSSRTNYIQLTSNNPLVKVCSGDKLQELINNIDVNFSYIPVECQILQENGGEFKVGDLLKITHKEKDYKFYITKILYKNNNSMSITSAEVTGRENSESNYTDKSMSMGGVNFYTTSTKTEINLQDCSQNTKVYITLNFYAEKEKYIYLKINDKFNRQFKTAKGNNNIGNIIDYEFKDGFNTLSFTNMNDEEIENYSISLIYQNASIVDVYEKDYDENDKNSPLNVEDVYFYKHNIRGLIKIKANAKLIIKDNMIGYNELNQVGQEVIAYCTDGTISINNEEDNFKIIIDDMHGNIVEYTEEELSKNENKIKIREDVNFNEYRYIDIPLPLGIITEYATTRYCNFGTLVGDGFELVADDKVEIPERVLLNLTQASYNFYNHSAETIVISDKFKMAQDLLEILYITSGNSNDSFEFYQTTDNKLVFESKYWGDKFIVYDENNKNYLEKYKEFKDYNLYKFNADIWGRSSTIDYDYILELTNNYNTGFYKYCIMIEENA